MEHPSEFASLRSHVDAFAPAGVLRASINLGHPVLARRDPAGGDPVGVSVDLARALADRLGVGLSLKVFGKAAPSVEAVRGERADVGFFDIDPARGEGLRFSAPCVLIEGSYLVPAEAPLSAHAKVDRTGVRIGVGSGSAYDLFLTRELKAARIERFLDAQAVVEALRDGRIDVAAGIRKQFEDLARANDGALRLLPGRFMVIRQAMGLAQSRGAEAAAALAGFVEEMKASGFVREALARHGIDGADVAPAASGG